MAYQAIEEKIGSLDMDDAQHLLDTGKTMANKKLYVLQTSE